LEVIRSERKSLSEKDDIIEEQGATLRDLEIALRETAESLNQEREARLRAEEALTSSESEVHVSHVHVLIQSSGPESFIRVSCEHQGEGFF
jgi:hypothetical protein